MHYDLIVIGGGISGLGVAALAAQKGHSVLLLERGQIASATSANSLRILHGGFRYLQHLNFPRVVLSLRDQIAFQRRYPSFCRSLDCLMPLHRTGLRSRVPLQCALLLYGMLSGFSGGGFVRGRTLSARELTTSAPMLAKRAPFGAFQWQDLLLTDPQGFHHALKSEALAYGVTIREETPASSVHQISRGYEVRAASRESSQEKFSGEQVVSTLGPWVDTLEVDPGCRPARPLHSWCIAFNLVLRRQFDSFSALAAEGAENRLYFLVPRNSGSALGTGYILRRDGESRTSPTNAEVCDFIAGANLAFPDLNLLPADVESVESGVLPCRPTAGAKEPSLIGGFEVYAKGGYVEVVSTKYTTFQSQARAVLRKLGRM